MILYEIPVRLEKYPELRTPVRRFFLFISFFIDEEIDGSAVGKAKRRRSSFPLRAETWCVTMEYSRRTPMIEKKSQRFAGCFGAPSVRLKIEEGVKRGLGLVIHIKQQGKILPAGIVTAATRKNEDGLKERMRPGEIDNMHVAASCFRHPDVISFFR